MRREERVTVQGPVKEQQPDGMSHREGGGRNHRGSPCPGPLRAVSQRRREVCRLPVPQVGVMGESSERDGRRQTRILDVHAGGYRVYSVNHHTGGEALRLDLEHEYDEATAPAPVSAVAGQCEDGFVACPDTGMFLATKPTEDDGCVLREDGGMECWYHMPNGALLEMVDGQLMEYEPDLEVCHTAAVPVPPQCHTSAIPLPSQCHPLAIPLPSQCHPLAIPLPSQCHPLAIPLPSQCHPSAIPLPSPCHTTAVPVPSQCHASAIPLPSQCHTAAIRLPYHRVCRPFIHEKSTKNTKKCESEENRELRIGTKMYGNVRIVGMMDATILLI